MEDYIRVAVFTEDATDTSQLIPRCLTPAFDRGSGCIIKFYYTTPTVKLDRSVHIVLFIGSITSKYVTAWEESGVPGIILFNSFTKLDQPYKEFYNGSSLCVECQEDGTDTIKYTYNNLNYMKLNPSENNWYTALLEWIHTAINRALDVHSRKRFVSSSSKGMEFILSKWNGYTTVDIMKARFGHQHPKSLNVMIDNTTKFTLDINKIVNMNIVTSAQDANVIIEIALSPKQAITKFKHIYTIFKNKPLPRILMVTKMFMDETNDKIEDFFNANQLLFNECVIPIFSTDEHDIWEAIYTHILYHQWRSLYFLTANAKQLEQNVVNSKSV
jgi:hypothetical protein